MKKLYIFLLFFSFVNAAVLAQIEDPKIEDNQKKLRAKVIVYTKSGEIYKGYFISQNKDFLELDTEDGGRISIPVQRIERVESLKGDESFTKEGDKRLEQVNPVRYILGTSAFNYEKGGNYLRNNVTTYHRGLTDNFSFGIGTSLWALVLRTPVIYINPHYTGKVGKNLHFKVGLDAFAASSLEAGEGGAAAIFNTGLTLGEPDFNITATVYYGALSDIGSTNPFYSLAGMARISKKLVVISEGFFIPSGFDEDFSIFFYGGRYLTEAASYDLGFFFNQEIADFVPFGIPFFAVTLKL